MGDNYVLLGIPYFQNDDLDRDRYPEETPFKSVKRKTKNGKAEVWITVLKITYRKAMSDGSFLLIVTQTHAQIQVPHHWLTQRIFKSELCESLDHPSRVSRFICTKYPAYRIMLTI